MMKRVGVGSGNVERLARRALDCGICHGDTGGALKRYFDGLYLLHRTANNVRVYGNSVFIFNDETLITVMTLPPKYANDCKRIRNRKRGERNAI
jgi:hypothetical protein